ncbi:MAG: hypothetical protein ACRED1_15015 [Limisphaerales bacterium]
MRFIPTLHLINTLSHANRERPAEMAETLFWRVLEYLKSRSRGFAGGQSHGPAFRFKSPIHIVDSSVLELVANCMDWAKHRLRKAAAKWHLRLNFQNLPIQNFWSFEDETG